MNGSSTIKISEMYNQLQINKEIDRPPLLLSPNRFRTLSFLGTQPKVNVIPDRAERMVSLPSQKNTLGPGQYKISLKFNCSGGKIKQTSKR